MSRGYEDRLDLSVYIFSNKKIYALVWLHFHHFQQKQYFYISAASGNFWLGIKQISKPIRHVFNQCGGWSLPVRGIRRAVTSADRYSASASVGCKLTALDGKDGEVMNGVGLSVEKLSCADDPAESVHVEEPLQVGVSVDGVPGSKKHTARHTHHQRTL